jgi:hypothetical protein
MAQTALALTRRVTATGSTTQAAEHQYRWSDIMSDIQFVVLEWIEDLPTVARYGFATLKHAEELGDNVRWHERCGSLEQAAAAAHALNSSLSTGRDALPSGR